MKNQVGKDSKKGIRRAQTSKPILKMLPNRLVPFSPIREKASLPSLNWLFFSFQSLTKSHSVPVLMVWMSEMWSLGSRSSMDGTLFSLFQSPTYKVLWLLCSLTNLQSHQNEAEGLKTKSYDERLTCTGI